MTQSFRLRAKSSPLVPAVSGQASQPLKRGTFRAGECIAFRHGVRWSGVELSLSTAPGHLLSPATCGLLSVPESVLVRLFHQDLTAIPSCLLSSRLGSLRSPSHRSFLMLPAMHSHPCLSETTWVVPLWAPGPACSTPVASRASV